MKHEEKKKKHAHNGFKSMHVELHKDGSATIHHEHEMPEKSVHHAVADLDGVHDSMEQHLGQPNEGEAEAEQGQSGIPEAAEAGQAGAMGQGQ